MGTLYLVSTPIGNLEDITQRALRVLREVPLIAAEDTRQTGKLLKRYDIQTRMQSYHEHSKEDPILTALSSGDVALVSDAGTPGVSDPGYTLIQAALEAGHQVVPIPGPSAVVAALSASGLPTHPFYFLGFLPNRSGQLRSVLEQVMDQPATVVAFEAPHRLRKTLQLMAEVLGPGRELAVCRELTKLHEEVLRGTVAEILAHFEQVEPRGEFSLVLGGAKKAQKWSESQVKAELDRLLEGGEQLSKAASSVAARSHWRKRDVYRLGVRE